MFNCSKFPLFGYWCQKVLPLVYDESLSYYEVLCKVIHKINEIIETNGEIIKELDALKAEVKTIQDWVDNFDTSYAEEIIKSYLATMIFVQINENGYITYYIPENWDNITFRTTGLDIEVEIQPEYGHLVLLY